jgi:hypothetical protein
MKSKDERIQNEIEFQRCKQTSDLIQQMILDREKEKSKIHVIDVINSCETEEQLQTACNLYKNYICLYSFDNEIYYCLEKKMQELNID